jgi:hypothetical protein
MKLKKNIMENPNPCWKGYEMVGMKMKDGKEVPNCVPKNEVRESKPIHKSAAGEWVTFLSTNKGKKLLKTFKSVIPAKTWLKKNADKFLEKDVTVGAMTKQQWDEREAKYAIENINEGNLNAYISSNDGKTFTIYNSNKKKVKNVSKQELEKLMRVGNNYSSTMNWNTFMAKFDKTTNYGKNWKYWKGNLINVAIPSITENLPKDGKKVYGGSGAKEGMALVGKAGLQKILDFSKKNPKNVLLVKDDNYTKFGPYYVKNGKVAKYTVANSNYDFDKNPVRGVKVSNDSILQFTIVESVNEGKWSNIMKGVKGGSHRGPWTIVVFDSGKKVIHQQPVDVRDAIPAHYEDIKRKFPNRRLAIEDNSGMVVFRESVNESSPSFYSSNYDKKITPTKPGWYVGYRTKSGDISYAKVPKKPNNTKDAMDILKKLNPDEVYSTILKIAQVESVSKKSTIKESGCGCGCGCGGTKKSNPYSLKEFAINESKYNFGKVEYTAKNMGPVEIQDLAFAYHQAPLNKLVSKNQDTKIRVARDLGRLLGKNPMNPAEKGKESAWLLYPYKGKLINTDEYKEIYKDLTDKLKKISNSLGRGGSIGSSSAAKAAAKADMNK